MKTAILLVSLLIASIASAQPTFCLTVQDKCCDDKFSSIQKQLEPGDEIDTLIVAYDAGGQQNQVEVKCYVDEEWQWMRTFCGCGWAAVPFIVANEHFLKFRVTCEVCSEYLGNCKEYDAIVKISPTPEMVGCYVICD